MRHDEQDSINQPNQYIEQDTNVLNRPVSQGVMKPITHRDLPIILSAVGIVALLTVSMVTYLVLSKYQSTPRKIKRSFLQPTPSSQVFTITKTPTKISQSTSLDSLSDETIN